jgi:hypothetical protein
MQFIKQKSTGKIVHRELPHTNKTLDNAAYIYKIDKTDLEVVKENWNDDEWAVAINNQLSYDVKRKREYDELNQYEMQFDDQRDGTTTWVDKINEIKSRHPKE